MSYASAVEALRQARRILLTSHVRPDGDAIGSLEALRQFILGLNPKTQSHILLLNACPGHYRFVLAGEPLVWDEPAEQVRTRAEVLDEYDLVVLVDTSAVRQLPGLGEYLRQRTKPLLVIDHHRGGDELGTIRIVDATAAAAGELVFELFGQARIDLTSIAATALFVAIATDTGWFRFENTRAESLAIAGQLIRAGAQPDKIYQQLFQNFPPERLRLVAKALDTLELHCGGQLAVMHITNAMLRESGARRGHIENIVNEPQQIGSVIATMLVVEQDDGTTRVSLRSREHIDVNALAGRFGGGGHTRAAGLTLPEPWPAVRQKVLAALMAVLGQPH